MTEEEEVLYENWVVNLFNAVKLEPVRHQQGNMIYESYVMKTWLPMVAADYVPIQTTKIVTSFPIKEMYENQYREYIAMKQLSMAIEQDSPGPPEEENNPFNPFSVSIPNANIDEEESDDEDTDEQNNDPRIKYTRTLH
jgi:hypothetical protein